MRCTWVRNGEERLNQNKDVKEGKEHKERERERERDGWNVRTD